MAVKNLRERKRERNYELNGNRMSRKDKRVEGKEKWEGRGQKDRERISGSEVFQDKSVTNGQQKQRTTNLSQ